uniref:DC-STAMP domain-containing protein 1 n=1 Tax=Monopterus albus TaxID=43700 RepID=UPI0009B3BF56|nr:DC-STAMP domain-containing protein 1 [Monopterus albus]
MMAQPDLRTRSAPHSSEFAPEKPPQLLCLWLSAVSLLCCPAKTSSTPTCCPMFLPAVERLGVKVLPPALHRLLFSQAGGSAVAHLAFRALFGGVRGTVLFLGLSNNLPPPFDLKLGTGVMFVALCVVAGALSSFFRCSFLLMFPSMLGSRGHAYLMVIILSLLHRGPVSNMQRNIEKAALSLSCNLDLQVNHSKLLWRDAVRPFLLITQELMVRLTCLYETVTKHRSSAVSAGSDQWSCLLFPVQDSKSAFQSEALSISSKFQTIRDEIVSQYGYDQFTPKRNAAAATGSTQQQFAAKTMMHCNSVVDMGVQRCADWFQQRWEECLEEIPVPIINHILCSSMKFHFLCDIMRVMTPWCREQIPVEGNFGQLFDQLNVSVDLLSREFSAELVLQEQQHAVLGGALMDQEFTQCVTASFQKLTTTMGQAVNVLQLLLSFTFVTIFIQAFGYVRQYRRDIGFDNVYITTYFRQIDTRRRKAGKRCLLPLKPSEKKKFINPWSLRIYPDELKAVMSSWCQVLYVSMLCVILLTVDFALFHVLDIVSRHTFTQLNVTSGHQVDIKVGGTSMMARLLQKTVSAFNSSSNLHIHTDNQGCVFPPSLLAANVPAGGHQVDIKVGGTSMMARLLQKTVSAFNSSSNLHIHTDNQGCVFPPSLLAANVYVSCVCCVLLVALLSCLQVYTNRLRRVIAAFYHPKREKKRILFLYNLQIQKRISSTDRKRIIN